MNILEKLDIESYPWKWSEECGIEVQGSCGWRCSLDFEGGEITPTRRMTTRSPYMLELLIIVLYENENNYEFYESELLRVEIEKATKKKWPYVKKLFKESLQEGLGKSTEESR